MIEILDDGPIIAASTNIDLPSAIAILRISGPIGPDDFYPLLKGCPRIIPRKAHYVTIEHSGVHYDTAIMLFFQGPNSYTGENLFEFHVHGNPFNVRRILSLFLSLSIPRAPAIRIAKAGEFTLRAYRNKKLTLAQVEGLDVLMKAKSVHVLNAGHTMLSGHLHEDFVQLRDLFITLKASLEIMIDFSDDVGLETGWKNFQDSMDHFEEKLQNLQGRIVHSASSCVSPEVLLFGEPNAGKSTLFNKLLGHQRANVSAIPGTTRDYVQETIEMPDFSFKLIDTAGLRETSDEIEQVSIEKVRELMGKVFFKVHVVNLLANHLENDQEADLTVYTHFDNLETQLPPCKTKGPYLLVGKAGPIGPPLLEQFAQFVREKHKQSWNSGAIIVERHIQLLTKATTLMQRFVQDKRSKAPIEGDLGLWAYELSEIDLLLHELVGAVDIEQVYESVFSHFCIGK